MLTDLFLSLHRLIRARRQVRWHWLPLLAAWYLFLTILRNWWDLASFEGSGDWVNIYYFVAYGHLALVIYLLVSVALPDRIGTDTVDLREYYFTHHRYSWALLGVATLLALVINAIKRYGMTGALGVPVPALVGSAVYLALCALLSISRRAWLHQVLLVIFVLGLAVDIVT